LSELSARLASVIDGLMESYPNPGTSGHRRFIATAEKATFENNIAVSQAMALGSPASLAEKFVTSDS